MSSTRPKLHVKLSSCEIIAILVKKYLSFLNKVNGRNDQKLVQSEPNPVLKTQWEIV